MRPICISDRMSFQYLNHFKELIDIKNDVIRTGKEALQTTLSVLTF